MLTSSGDTVELKQAINTIKFTPNTKYKVHTIAEWASVYTLPPTSFSSVNLLVFIEEETGADE